MRRQSKQLQLTLAPLGCFGRWVNGSRSLMLLVYCFYLALLKVAPPGCSRIGSMKALLLTACLPLCLLISAQPASAAEQDRYPRFTQADSFALALGTDLSESGSRSSLAGYGIAVVDGQQSRSRDIAALQASGTLVIGYLSVGTLEPWRPWYKRLIKFRLKGKTWGEPYARVSSSAYQRELTRIASRLAAKGFDGLFLDNMDVVERYPSEAQGMRLLLSRISGQLRQEQKLVIAQNSFSFAKANAALLSGWNREDVSFTFSTKRRSYESVKPSERRRAGWELKTMRRLGLKTFATDYLPDQSAAWLARDFACAQGALSFTSNIELTDISPASTCAV